jgi:glycosyltransferase involved in cell wall biosynthesis
MHGQKAENLEGVPSPVRDWTESGDSQEEMTQAILSDLMTAEFVRVSAATNLYEEKMRDIRDVAPITQAFEYAAANLFLRWLNGNALEDIRKLVSLIGTIHRAVPHSQIVTAVYALSLFEEGNLVAAESEFPGLPTKRELTPLIEDLCVKALQEIREVRILNLREPAPARLLLLDTAFPSQSSSFRYAEFSTYLGQIESSSYSARPDHNIFKHGEGSDFLHQVERYISESGIAACRIRRFDSTELQRVKLAYCVFLNAADLFFSQIGIPSAEHFVFTLYPGGGFFLDDDHSDAKLRRLCDNPKLAKIITTQKLTYDYLVENNFCEPARLRHVFGVPVPGAFRTSSRPRHIVSNGEPVRVCFVAHRYSRVGAEKGYDVFADVVRILSNSPDFHFHVVGNYDHNVVDLGDAKNITFHGIKPADFFPRFYAEMDAIVSPNIQMSELEPSCPAYFDGFPTTCVVEAGLQGTAMLTTDFLKLNQHLDGTQIFSPEELQIIDRNPESIAKLLKKYAYDRAALVRLGEAGRQALLREFSFEKQMRPRIDLLNEYLQN